MISRQNKMSKTLVIILSIVAILQVKPNWFCKNAISRIAMDHQTALKIILNLNMERGEAIIAEWYGAGSEKLGITNLACQFFSYPCPGVLCQLEKLMCLCE